MKTDVHENSIAAYRGLDITRRERAILDWVARHGPHTDREIAAGMGFPHRSYVQPRISELIDAGLLFESGRVLCEETRRTVRQVDVVPPRKTDLIEQCQRSEPCLTS